jgi:hypothetical protein
MWQGCCQAAETGAREKFSSELPDQSTASRRLGWTLDLVLERPALRALVQNQTLARGPFSES